MFWRNQSGSQCGALVAIYLAIPCLEVYLCICQCRLLALPSSSKPILRSLPKICQSPERTTVIFRLMFGFLSFIVAAFLPFATEITDSSSFAFAYFLLSLFLSVLLSFIEAWFLKWKFKRQVIGSNIWFKKFSADYWRLFWLMMLLSAGSQSFLVCVDSFALWLLGLATYGIRVFAFDLPDLLPQMKNFHPEPSDLKAQVENLLGRVGFSPADVYSGDDRGPYNAYFRPGLRKNAIVLGSGLIEASQGEILGVLAHELGHWNGRHVYKAHAIFQLYCLCIILLSAILEIDPLWLLPPAYIFGSYLYRTTLHYSELEADQFAKRCGFGDGLASFLMKPHCREHHLFTRFHSTHPPAEIRIEALGWNIPQLKKDN